MPMIFPGMDPGLEDPQLWPGAHASLIVYLRDQLQPLLRPRYIAAVEERVYLEPQPHPIIPDVRIRRRKPERESDSPAVAVVDMDEPIEVEIPPLEIHEPYIEILDRLLRLRVPLAGDDPDVRLDLQTAIAQVYEAGRYRDRIDYGEPCRPPLSDADRQWAASLCKAADESEPDATQEP